MCVVWTSVATEYRQVFALALPLKTFKIILYENSYNSSQPTSNAALNFTFKFDIHISLHHNQIEVLCLKSIKVYNKKNEKKNQLNRAHRYEKINGYNKLDKVWKEIITAVEF